MTGWAFGFALPIGAAFAVTRLLLPRGAAATVLALGLAAGGGLGVSGVWFVAWRFATPASWMIAYRAVDATLWILVLSLALLAWRRRTLATGRPLGPGVFGLSAFVLGAAMAYAAFWVLSNFDIRTIRMPHGEWDAWAVWNLKARFLLRGVDSWTTLFSPALPHPGYPLLLPGSVARLWLWLGQETVAAPAVMAITFVCATPAVVAGGLALLRSWSTGMWGALIVLAAAPLTYIGAYQIADVPLAFGIVAAVVLIAIDVVDGRSWRLAALSGGALGLAGLTKDEGLPFMIGMTGCYLACQLVGWRRPAWRARALAFTGATLPAWVLLYAVRSAAPSTGLAQAVLAPDAVGKLFDAVRHREILSAFVERTWLWAGDDGPGVLLFFGAALLLGGYRVKRQLVVPASFGAAAIVIMFASYYAAFVVTPYDLTWHLTSLDRILLHVWPAFVWVFCLGAATESPGHDATAGGA